MCTIVRTKELHKHCQLKPDAQAQLKMAITELNFSAPPSSRYPPERRDRDYDRILKVARTIAGAATDSGAKP